LVFPQLHLFGIDSTASMDLSLKCGCVGELTIGQWLLFVCVVDFPQHAGNECKQLVEGVKSGGPGGRDMLDPSLESSGRDVSFSSELDDESRFVLRFLHGESIIGQAWDLSHKTGVKFR
jgi:hypothetical protein